VSEIDIRKISDPNKIRYCDNATITRVSNVCLKLETDKHIKLIASGEKHDATKHLTKPCSDCPLRRDALNGWLGGSTPEEYAILCHSDAVVDCHVHAGSRCAGLAIYRTNTCKGQPKEHKLPADHNVCFSNIMQFLEHHNSPIRKVS
jgi:hypothetical protein